MKNFFTSYFTWDPGTAVPKLVFIAVVILLMLLVRRLVNASFQRTIRLAKDSGKGNVTYLSFARYIVIAVVYIAAATLIIYSVEPLKAGFDRILAGSGIAALIVGFAAQDALSNVVSGFVILSFKPFAIGDVVRFVGNNITGVVEDITLRHTALRTPENKRLIVPNSKMSAEILENANYADTKVCLFLEIGITYESSVDEAMEIICREVAKHKDFIDTRAEGEQGKPAVSVKVVELGESAVILRAHLWAKDQATAFDMKCDLLYTIKKAVDASNVDFAYPHVVTVQK